MAFSFKTGRSLLPLCLVVATSAALEAQSVFTLGFSGPTTLGGPAEAEEYYLCTLKHEGGGKGVPGWSLSMTAEGASLLAIDLVGTTTEQLFAGGFEKSEVTTGAGNEGAVSAIILSFMTDVTLPVDASSSLARIRVRGGPGPFTLKYIDGRRGVGQPVTNVVTQGLRSITPNFTDLQVNGGVQDPEACGVRLGDKVGGSLASTEDDDAYSFAALGGTLLSVKLKGAGTVPPGLKILAPSGGAIDPTPFLKPKKGSFGLKNLGLPETGTYKLVLEGLDGAAGAYNLALKGKAPKDQLSVKRVSSTSAGQIVEIGFNGLLEALLNVSVKGKGLAPEIVELLGPDGNPVGLGGTLVPGAKTAKIVNLSLPATGSYTLRIRGTGAEGAAGVLTTTIKQKLLKGVALSECQEN